VTPARRTPEGSPYLARLAAQYERLATATVEAERVVAQLSAQQSATLHAAQNAGYSLREIAAAVGLSHQSVDKRIRLASREYGPAGELRVRA
jgi:DNA-directed RNA polymerase specialized sigma24 family protein